MRSVRFTLVLAAAGLLLAAWGAPWLEWNGFGFASLVVKDFFHAVCHQRPERSFWFLGQPWAVCVRCAGIYAGLALGVLPQMGRASAKRIFLALVILNGLDVAAEIAGFHGNLSWLRLALGLGLGAAASALLLSREEKQSILQYR
jgi:uncharacterized membrane protein